MLYQFTFIVSLLVLAYFRYHNWCAMIVDGSVCFVKDGWEGRRRSATFFNCWSNGISRKTFLKFDYVRM